MLYANRPPSEQNPPPSTHRPANSTIAASQQQSIGHGTYSPCRETPFRTCNAAQTKDESRSAARPLCSRGVFRLLQTVIGGATIARRSARCARKSLRSPRSPDSPSAHQSERTRRTRYSLPGALSSCSKTFLTASSRTSALSGSNSSASKSYFSIALIVTLNSAYW
jgi:hypothetical protein